MSTNKFEEINEVPFAKSFSGHETFAFRYSWLKKGFDQLLLDRDVFQRDDAIVKLGVGKNMVRSIRHWCLATKILEEIPGTHGKYLQPSQLGMRLMTSNGWDPFLEDDATLWLMHWNLASIGTRTAMWYWAFNRYYEYAFTRAGMFEALRRALHTLGWTDIADSTIKRDTDCFIHTYLPPKSGESKVNDSIECPLANLNILVQEPYTDRYRFVIGPKPSLPPSVFSYAILEYWDQTNTHRDTLELREIMRSEGSPVLIFKLDEESVLSFLDNIHTVSMGCVLFEDTPLVRRLVRKHQHEVDPLTILENYYESQ